MAIPGSRRTATPRLLDGTLDSGAIQRVQRPVSTDGVGQAPERLGVRTPTGPRAQMVTAAGSAGTPATQHQR
jgi:hypothetical protein